MKLNKIEFPPHQPPGGQKKTPISPMELDLSRGTWMTECERRAVRYTCRNKWATAQFPLSSYYNISWLSHVNDCHTSLLLLHQAPPPSLCVAIDRYMRRCRWIQFRCFLIDVFASQLSSGHFWPAIFFGHFLTIQWNLLSEVGGEFKEGGKGVISEQNCIMLNNGYFMYNYTNVFWRQNHWCNFEI